MFVAECALYREDCINRGILQWGRNMFVAEWRRETTQHGRNPEPSMGPQHVRCGMTLLSSRFKFQFCPSMGPQHVRCGMPMSCSMGRNLPFPSMGPQHVRCGMIAMQKSVASQCSALQWGRNMFVAECDHHHVGGDHEGLHPSMGPQHVRCGMQNLRRAPRCSYRLQWGRNMFVAECGRHSWRGCAPCPSFNGAATCSLRNVCGLEMKGCGPAQPSMGPQHVRCGMCPATQYDGGWEATFNGAATCSLRNVIHICMQWQTDRPPSMGPQHVRCGMHPKCMEYAIQLVLQWGRNMFVAECGRRHRDDTPAPAPSMGPQHVRCGMMLSCMLRQ